MLKLIKEQFFDIRREEWPRALALSAFFFLVIAAFWIFKPIKKGALIGFYEEDSLALWGMTFGGAEVEQLAKVVNMVVIYLVVVLFTLLVRRFERQQVIYIFCGIISVAIVYFGWRMAAPGAFDVWAFFVFGDIFNSIMVAVFWAFTNDVNTPEQSKRLYGIIGLGGVIGGAVGAQFVQQFVEQESVGRGGLIWGTIGAMALIALITWYVDHRARSADRAAAEEEEEGAEKKTSISALVEGARLVFSSKYMLAILAILGLYEMVSNIVEFQLSATVEASSREGTEIDAFFGLWGWLISITSIVAQLFLTPYMMNRRSVGAALLVLPVLDLVFSGGFLLLPALYMVLALSVVDNGLNYSINQSAKEALYTPTSRDEKYKGKAFIDMFGQRAAKVIAVGVNLAFAALVSIHQVRWLSVISILLVAGWILAARYAGAYFAERSEEQPAAS